VVKCGLSQEVDMEEKTRLFGSVKDESWTRHDPEAKARKIFESLLRIPGEWDGRKYVTKNIQTYWRWFRLGWQMRGHNEH